MIIDGKKHVVLYLTSWQMRMVEDVLGEANCRVWYVPVGNSSTMKYIGPDDTGSGAKRMYLTEWQRREIKDIANEDCVYIELGPSEPIIKYNGPHHLKPRTSPAGEVTYEKVPS
ncbi:MAG: hypothetical protein ACLQPD_13335 [Desulfomonilaceae bacterium]